MEKEHQEIESTLLETIGRLTKIKEERLNLVLEEKELSKPILHDINLVGNIYDLFMSSFDGKSTMWRRKMFIFVVLYLYSPSALAGTKMRRGLRYKIASVLGCTCSNVSHDYKNVRFFYTTYKAFRMHVNNSLSLILSKWQK